MIRNASSAWRLAALPNRPSVLPLIAPVARTLPARSLHSSTSTCQAQAPPPASEPLPAWARAWEGIMDEAIMRRLLASSKNSLTLDNISRSELYHNEKLLAGDNVPCPKQIKSARDFAQFMSFLDLDISRTHGLFPMGVSLPVGKFLQTQVRMMGARRILELGTLGGFSTLWLATGAAQPLQSQGGSSTPKPAAVVTLELDQRHAEVARANFDLAKRLGVEFAPIDVRVGSALDTLRAMPAPASADEAFDFIFIDADKEGYPAYYKEVKRLARPGSVLMIDNMGWQGAVADPAVPDSDCGGHRAVLDLIDKDGIDAFTIHTANQKAGVDGFLMAVLP